MAQKKKKESNHSLVIVNYVGSLCSGKAANYQPMACLLYFTAALDDMGDIMQFTPSTDRILFNFITSPLLSALTQHCRN